MATIKKAILEKEISEYELEQRYFEKYYKEQDIEEIGKIFFYNNSIAIGSFYVIENNILFYNSHHI